MATPESPRPERRRRRGGAFLLLLAFAAAAWWGWLRETRRPLRPASAPPLMMTVPPGASVHDVGVQLYRLGLVRHPAVFQAVVMLRGDQGRLRAGEYALQGGLDLAQIVDKLVRGDVVRHVVTFPEGTNLEEMAVIVAGQGLAPAAFLAAARDPTPIRDLDPKARPTSKATPSPTLRRVAPGRRPGGAGRARGPALPRR
jgi:UPF0755 protein